MKGQKSSSTPRPESIKRFHYKVLDLNQRRKRGVVVATDVASAQEQLLSRGWRLIELNLIGASKWGGVQRKISLSAFWRFKNPKIKKELQLSLIQRLAALLASGLPLLQSLALLESQSHSRLLREKVAQLRTYVREGHPFSEALLHVQPFLDSLSIHMLRAAEARGSLPETLSALTALWRKRMATVRQIQSALAYPCIVACLGLLVMGFLSLWVLPRFKLVFASSFGGAPLPWLTRCILAVPEHTGLLSACVFATCSAFLFLALAPRRWGLGVRVFSHIPLGARFLQDHIVIRLGYSLGALLGAGVPILQSLSLSAALLPSYRYRPGLLRARGAIQNGKSLSEALAGVQCFPQHLIDSVQVGEASGRLPELLQLLAQDATHAQEARLNRLVALLEPTVLLVLAVFVGALALGLFLPLTQLLEQN